MRRRAFVGSSRLGRVTFTKSGNALRSWPRPSSSRYARAIPTARTISNTAFAPMARTARIEPVRACFAIAPARIYKVENAGHNKCFINNAIQAYTRIRTFGSVPLATLSCCTESRIDGFLLNSGSKSLRTLSALRWMAMSMVFFPTGRETMVKQTGGDKLGSGKGLS